MEEFTKATFLHKEVPIRQIWVLLIPTLKICTSLSQLEWIACNSRDRQREPKVGAVQNRLP